MSSIDNEILLGAEEDAKEVAFILNYIGQENREKFTEDDIYYCIDIILEELDKMESKADADGFIDIDVEELVKVIEKKAKKEAGEVEEDAEFEPEKYVVQRLNKGKTWIGWVSANNGGNIKVEAGDLTITMPGDEETAEGEGEAESN